MSVLVDRLFGDRWQRWLNRRLPATRSLVLSHRAIFIVPTRIGLLYLALVALLLVTAINYQNSLIYGMAFWLFSVGLSAMLLTFRNLTGLTVSSQEAIHGYAGQVFDLPLRLVAAPRREHLNLWLQYPDNPGQRVSIERGSAESVRLSYRCYQRGYLSPGRVLLESRFPLGLFRAWSWIKLDFSTLVYPQPQPSPFVFRSGEGAGELLGATLEVRGEQDFRGLRQYQPGDSMRQIAWKQLARGKGLVTKDFDSDEGASCWLDWANTSGDLESRLSQLCGWVLEAHQLGWQYGVRLPGQESAPEHSDAHLGACLKMLTLYQLDQPSESPS
ncbi:DUF58 domain-containing protein [Oceanobacter sp. 4_MG-2023]|uniref:DUF58 domain-containing protein n=2 Tax=Gammaproteobacteria TaxID=1236 RepID=UPI0027356731|nr:DUF58 domain-containing protein [Oceanobacter sp. 4_MG-2023]MDP2548709.1 DUF58 domain-containing protein [Oceanobacter sp. 4_MG-2023]